MLKRFMTAAAGLLLATGLAAGAHAADKFITVASTTSTQNSGLFEHMLPAFTKKTGIAVHVVAVGTGQAIKLAEKCDADVLFVHHKPSELKFVAAGYGGPRHDVMYNDFVVVGPKSDPAGIKGMKDVAAAMAEIASKKQPFVSRGDNSGTNKKELELWKDAKVDTKAASGTWYRESGSGMGATLNTAAGMNGYTLTDRGTWLSFKNRGDLQILVEGDKRLFNQYGIMLVSEKHCPSVKAELGQSFVDWVISKDGQKNIADYKLGGEQLFFPNAGKTGS
ncbi:tungstate transport system substrate-binding protein [Tistlia consotensis]|uniref:Tungstate transport system substrate-binding protein n=1 Tax=Tistlia consotensis USBA 355 TaxID=560819 RepID=A0A1Y6BR51_9PROT|nr:substrate-binding domain-containing protein [Tistlia consotensis]SMF23731.1 tungstate transport system substrate-binding protein [Tistlia consotensis USBA 355]SNR61329.1 tungstate transport system substrate-binding protein [Tistlia consotensis]